MFTLNLHIRTRPNPNLPILAHAHQSTKIHNPIPHMALRIHLLPSILPSQPLKFHPYPSLPAPLFTSTPKTLISSCTKKTQDSDLASDLAKELQKLNTHFVEREEAMKKSRELLVNDLCQHLGFKTEELKKKWGNLSEDDKCVLIKGFVEEWGVNFHPLSAKSVKEMVDEQLGEESQSVKNSSLLGSDENFGDFTKEISWF